MSFDNTIKVLSSDLFDPTNTVGPFMISKIKTICKHKNGFNVYKKKL